MSFGIDFFNIYHSIDTGCASFYLEGTEAGAKSSMPEKKPSYDLTLWIKTIAFFFFLRTTLFQCSLYMDKWGTDQHFEVSQGSRQP